MADESLPAAPSDRPAWVRFWRGRGRGNAVFGEMDENLIAVRFNELTREEMAWQEVFRLEDLVNSTSLGERGRCHLSNAQRPARC